MKYVFIICSNLHPNCKRITNFDKQKKHLSILIFKSGLYFPCDMNEIVLFPSIKVFTFEYESLIHKIKIITEYIWKDFKVFSTVRI